MSAALFSDGTRAFSVTVSIGATTEAGESLEQMISAADKQLYHSKTTGRNRTSMSLNLAKDQSPKLILFLFPPRS